MAAPFSGKEGIMQDKGWGSVVVKNGYNLRRLQTFAAALKMFGLAAWRRSPPRC
jgi:hypothetical protein